MSFRFRVPPHGKTTYPHPIWRSTTCHLNFTPPMAKHGTGTPCGGQKHVISYSHAPPWHNLVPTSHMKVIHMSIQFRVPPPWQNKVPTP